MAAYTRSYDWTDDRDAGTKILATRFDTEMDGMVTNLNNRLDKDGSVTPTANQPMGGFRHTGVGNASARDNYSAAGQIQDNSLNYVVAAGSANAITLDLTPSITAYATGQVFYFKAASANTAATTVNIDSVGAKNIYENGAALQGGEIQADFMYAIVYDGTQFNLVRLGNGLITYNVQAGTTYTLTAADCGKCVIFTSGSAVTCTIPQQSTTTLKQGWFCKIRQEGAGQVTVAVQGSDVVRSIGSATKTRAQYSEAVIDLRTAGSPNTFYLFGDISS